MSFGMMTVRQDFKAGISMAGFLSTGDFPLSLSQQLPASDKVCLPLAFASDRFRPGNRLQACMPSARPVSGIGWKFLMVLSGFFTGNL